MEWKKRTTHNKQIRQEFFIEKMLPFASCYKKSTHKKGSYKSIFTGLQGGRKN